jgi:hypothetical protein
MHEGMLIQNLWVWLLLWFLSFISDYYLTLYGARLYRAYGREHIVFGGSYELTPFHQEAIDELRPISVRLLALLVVSGIAIGLVWLLSIVVVQATWPFSLLMGGLLLRQAAVHVRHFRNLALYRDAGVPGALAGQIAYARWVVLHQSAVELWGFAGLFLFAYLATGSLFLAGGALSCTVTGWQHYRLSRKARQLATGGIP